MDVDVVVVVVVARRVVGRARRWRRRTVREGIALVGCFGEG